MAVRRFETPPGKQEQVDWGHLGSLAEEGETHTMWGFTMTLGYSRRMIRSRHQSETGDIAAHARLEALLESASKNNRRTANTEYLLALLLPCGTRLRRLPIGGHEHGS